MDDNSNFRPDETAHGEHKVRKQSVTKLQGASALKGQAGEKHEKEA